MRHLSQKYLGLRPNRHLESMFVGPQIQGGGAHPLPVSNFMNAQCMFLVERPYRSTLDADCH